MRLLDRYLLREFLVPLGYCLCGFLIFWIAFDLFGKLRSMQEQHLLTRDIAEYYFFKLPGPEFLPVALPVALLLALLYALTNHARCNELTAMRAAGLSLWRLALPYQAFGLLASLVLFALNEFCAPTTEEIAERILTRRVQRHLTAEERQQIRNPPMIANSKASRFWKIGIYNEVTGEMIRPRVEWRLAGGSWRSIEAERALHTNGVWTFYGNVRQSIQSNTLPLKLPVVSTLALPEFTETPDEIKSDINIQDRLTHRSRTRRADVPIAEILNFLRLHPEPQAAERSWLYTKLQGRFAGPFTCLVVVLIGVPFGTASGRRSAFVGVAASLSIFFAYYLLQQIGFILGETGRMPPNVAAWLPNLAFGLAGLWMMARAR